MLAFMFITEYRNYSWIKMLEYGNRLTSAQNIVQHVLQFSGADGFILQTHGEECKTY